MRTSLERGWEQPSQRWDHDELAQLQGGHDDLLAGLGQVVLVGVPDLLDEAMHVQPFEQARQRRTGIVRQDPPQAGVAEATDLPFATRQGGEEGEVRGAEEVEAAITARVVAGRLCHLFDPLDACGRVAQVGEEGQIAAIGRVQQVPQRTETVDGPLRDLLGASLVSVEPSRCSTLRWWRKKETSLTVVSLRRTRTCLS